MQERSVGTTKSGGSIQTSLPTSATGMSFTTTSTTFGTSDR